MSIWDLLNSQLHNNMFKLIAAIGKNRELGKNNNLIWHLPNDLTFFKGQTMNHPIIMGYKTYESLPKKLKGRQYILLTSKNIEEEDILVFHSKEEMLEKLDLSRDYFVIGGASIYQQFIDLCDELYLTEIDKEDSNADAFFPEFDKSMYERTVLDSNSDDGINYDHVLYRRLK